MAEEPSELREQIDRRRESIAGTVDQIENRVSPSRIAARRTSRIRRRLTDMADSVLGNDEPEYVDYNDNTSNSQSAIERAQQATPDVDDIRRQARGNPLAAGMISFGAGMLLGSVLPESAKERKAARNIQPQLRDAATEAAAVGQGVAQELKEPAQQAASDLKETAADHASDLKSEATDAAGSVADAAKS